jgi:hypothetical protein
MSLPKLQTIGFSICLILAGCATHPDGPPTPTPEEQAQKAQDELNAKIAAIKVGTPRADVEKALGQPVSVKDSAEMSSVIWAFGRQPAAHKSSSGAWSTFGNLAATAAGMTIPFAGLVTQLGTTAWAAHEDTKTAVESQNIDKNTIVVTVEFKEDKVFSIQRARPFLGVTAAAQ